ncbi:eukaryotic membrane protein family-domain-containing protein [Blastocladiella britannica]|nr:eukaryotic membrane protein family-domain-containing protein [Blastocladiella britannica]
MLSMIQLQSWLYHTIRGQSMMKLYVIFNLLEVCDRLCCSFGMDIMDSLFARSVKKASPQALPLAVHFVLAGIYVTIHSIVLYYQMVTLNVSINSYSNGLLPLLISNQFVEIKSNVFKRYDVENLFQLTCADMVERVNLTVFLSLNVARNFLELLNNTDTPTMLPLAIPYLQVAFPAAWTDLSWNAPAHLLAAANWIVAHMPATLADLAAVFPNSVAAWWDQVTVTFPAFASAIVADTHQIFAALPDLSMAWWQPIAGQQSVPAWLALAIDVLTPALAVAGSEVLVDSLKHAFITKFNAHRPDDVYRRFRRVLCADLVSAAWVQGPTPAATITATTTSPSAAGTRDHTPVRRPAVHNSNSGGGEAFLMPHAAIAAAAVATATVVVTPTLAKSTTPAPPSTSTASTPMSPPPPPLSDSVPAIDGGETSDTNTVTHPSPPRRGRSPVHLPRLAVGPTPTNSSGGGGRDSSLLGFRASSRSVTPTGGSGTRTPLLVPTAISTVMAMYTLPSLPPPQSSSLRPHHLHQSPVSPRTPRTQLSRSASRARMMAAAPHTGTANGTADDGLEAGPTIAQDMAPHVARRIGFGALPLAVVTVRMALDLLEAAEVTWGVSWTDPPPALRLDSGAAARWATVAWESATSAVAMAVGSLVQAYQWYELADLPPPPPSVTSALAAWHSALSLCAPIAARAAFLFDQYVILGSIALALFLTHVPFSCYRRCALF